MVRKRRHSGATTKVLSAHACKLFVALSLLLPQCLVAETIRVGPNERYRMPSEAAQVAQDGDIVEIAAGDYPADVAVWAQNDLTIRGTGKGAHLAAAGFAAEAKGIWVIRGDDVVVENVEFSGAKVPDKNGAGIRHQGGNLTIINCRFHDNQNGILSNKGGGVLSIDRSVFRNNGAGDGRSHNIYAGRIKQLKITASYFHHAKIGHNIKSRAYETYIHFSKIMDGDDGESSYLIDLPDAGYAELTGNILQQGPASRNRTMISFGAESPEAIDGEVYLIHNTLVNDRPNGTFLRIANPLTRAHLQNNLFVGPGTISNLDVRSISNLQIERERRWFSRSHLFVDRANFDYRLAPGSQAIDVGSVLDPSVPGSEKARYEYHEVSPVLRSISGAPDAGAFEYDD